MDDLVKRLRNGVAEFPVIIEHPSKIMKEAADRIEQLQQQVAQADLKRGQKILLFKDTLETQIAELQQQVDAVRGLSDKWREITGIFTKGPERREAMKRMLAFCANELEAAIKEGDDE